MFFVRIISGKSPFDADRQHIHHLMLDAGLNHLQATGVLIAVNALVLFTVVKSQAIGNLFLLIIIIIYGLVLTGVLLYLKNSKNRVSNNAV